MDKINNMYIKEHIDDLDKVFNVIDMEYTIEKMKIDNDFLLENSLIKFRDKSILFEDANGTAKDTGFKAHIHKIFQAILNFIDNIMISVKELFNSKTITIDDYISYGDGKIQFEKDLDKMEKVVNEEMAKGETLLHRIATSNGVTDEEVKQYVELSKERIKNIGPKTVVGGLGAIQKHIGYQQVSKKLRKNRSTLQKSQNIMENFRRAASGDTSSDLALKIADNMSYISHLYGNEIMKSLKHFKRDIKKKNS